MDLSTILLCAIIFIFTYLLFKKDQSNIPGPYAWPVVGNLPFLMTVPVGKRAVYFQTLADQYGSVFRIKLGPYTVVWLYGYETIYNAFVKNGHVFTDRPNWLPGVEVELDRGKGLVWENGEKWKKIRRFTLQTMRDLGVGKKSLEEIILDEVKNLDSVLEKTDGQQIDDIKEIMYTAVCNIIHSIVFGFRYSHDDEQLHNLQHYVDELFRGSPPISIGAIFPQFLRQLLDQKARKVVTCRELLFTYIDEQIAEHEKTFDGKIRDFIDLYLRAQKTDDGKDSTFMKTNIFRVIYDLFAAGTDTTGSTLEWTFLYLIGYPDVQQKCYDEIEKHVGCGRMVTLADRGNLAYVEATIMEVQRLSNVASATLPHTTTEPITINGYDIQKGEIVIAALQSVHFDKKHWDEPNKFKPERFVDENGKLRKSEYFMCFSLGPRVCPGESLAKTELFLTISNLIQRFKFQKADETDVLNFEGFETFTTGAHPYRLKATRRT